MSNNFISVIIPTYNEEAYILRSLKQFENNHHSFEVVVVDGGSRDATYDIAHNYRTRAQFPLLVLRSGKRGRACQMNEGAKKAKGNILHFLHADSILSENAFDVLQNALSDSQIIGGAFRVAFFRRSIPYRLINHYSNLRARFFGMYHGDQGIFIRRNIFEKHGGFQEIPIMEDVALSQEMKKSGKTVLLPSQISSSERRIQANGIFKSIYMYFFIKGLYYCGFSPNTVKRFYMTLKKE